MSDFASFASYFASFALCFWAFGVMFLVSSGLRHVLGRDQKKSIEWGSRYIYIYINIIIQFNWWIPTGSSTCSTFQPSLSVEKWVFGSPAWPEAYPTLPGIVEKLEDGWMLSGNLPSSWPMPCSPKHHFSTGHSSIHLIGSLRQPPSNSGWLLRFLPANASKCWTQWWVLPTSPGSLFFTKVQMIFDSRFVNPHGQTQAMASLAHALCHNSAN